MQIFKYKFENLNIASLNAAGIDPNDVLYFDIETTGLSRQRNQIYLIGCGYYEAKKMSIDSEVSSAAPINSDISSVKPLADLNIIQWFADDLSEEALIIQAFKDFFSSYTTFINYNGRSFDLPFICARANKYNIELNFDDYKNIDLYTYVKPYKKLLGLNDIKQKTLELFLKINRDDLYSGEELIDVYKRYAANHTAKGKTASDLDKLLLHNLEDVKNMHYLLPLMDLKALGGLVISYVNHSVSEYTGYCSDAPKYELVVNASHNLELDICFTSIINIDGGTYAVSYSQDKLSLRIPIKCDTLSFYFENYKDYYYLPNEDMCILKSVASGVAKEYRENATKENCKVSLNGKFIYAFAGNDASLDTNIQDANKKFKAVHNSKFEYIRLEDFEEMSTEAKTNYINSIIKCFTQ